MSPQKDKKAGDAAQYEVTDAEPETAAVADLGESILSLSPYSASPRSIPSFRRSNLSKYTWHEIDESSLSALAALDPFSRCAYEKLGYLPGLARYPLGDFQIDEHRSVSFEVIPALGEVSYSEVSEYPPGTARRPNKEDDNTPSPLLRFLQVTKKTVPVPLMLFEFDDRSDEPEVERALAGRDLVDSIDDYGRQLTLVQAPTQSSSEPPAVPTCFSGGDDVFSSTYCESKGIWNCDNGAWESLTRHTGSNKRYVSHSRVAACGVVGTYVEHQFRYWDWDDAKWRWTTVQYPLPPPAWWQTIGGGEVKYWKHVGGKKRRRKIKIWTDEPSYFRAWTAFYN